MASGPVVNLAARLASVSGAGQLVAGPEAIRRVGDRYQIDKIGCKHLKNVAQPLDIYRILGRSESNIAYPRPELFTRNEHFVQSFVTPV